MSANGIPQDGPERLRYAAQVMLAAADGAEIEISFKGEGKFTSIKSSGFDWGSYDYRIAPEKPKAPRVCKAYHSGDGDDPWRSAYPLSAPETGKSEVVPLIELTAEVRAALAAAGIDYEGKEGA